MPLLVTPQQLDYRAELYHQLAALTSAGIGLLPALEMVHRAPPSRAFVKPVARVISLLNQGCTFSESLAQLGGWLPSFDVALIEAGEKSGRLDSCLRLLEKYYNERATLARRVISDLLYPAFIFHFAVLIFPVTQLQSLVLEGDVVGFILKKAAVFAPIYGVLLLAIFACQGRHGEWWRAWIERVLARVPILGSARRQLALARLSAALEGLLSAGVTIIEAWELAAISSGSPALKNLVLSWRPALDSGETPAEMIFASGQFPELFASLYATGEKSGKLDETLRRLFEHYQSEASRKLHALSQWAPRLIYMGIIVMVGYQVISFWSGYFSKMKQLSQ